MKITNSLLLPLICLAAFGFFSIFRSHNLVAVDGVLRCLEVYYQPGKIFFHGNNHLLYPFNVYLWQHLVGAQTSDPLQYVRTTQLMNGVFAAGSVALTFSLARKIGASIALALGGAVCLMFSRAFMLHATNSAEPLAGFFWSLVSIRVAVFALERGTVVAAVLSGIVLALAMACYQSMVTIGPALVILLWNCRRSYARTRVSLIGGFLAGGFLGVLVIFGAAYSHSGIQGVMPKAREFFSVPAHDVFGGFSERRVLNIPIGLVSNVVPALPHDYTGLRSLWSSHRHDRYMAILLVSATLIFGFLLLLIYTAWKKSAESHREIVPVLVAGFLATLLCPLYWDPTYDKLWLQPLFCLILFCIALLKNPGLGKLRLFGVSLLAMIVISNAVLLVRSSRQKFSYLEEAAQVQQVLKPHDLLVTDWDGISEVYYGFYQNNGRIFNFVTNATASGDLVRTNLQNEIDQTIQRGGQVYFLGILDQTKQSWDSFLGEKAGVPYSSLDDYRREAEIIKKFQLAEGEVTLRQLRRVDGKRT